MTDSKKAADQFASGLQDLQNWTATMAQAQQAMLEQAMKAAQPPGASAATDPMALYKAGAEFWANSAQVWQNALSATPGLAAAAEPLTDKRFSAPQWRDNPVSNFVHQSYLQLSKQLLANTDQMPGLDEKQRKQIAFATQGMVDAMSPSNFAFTNPQVLEKAIETKGESLRKGFAHMLADLQRGQLTHTDEGAFELGRNLATTPGKVIYEAPLFQLIHYTPTTEAVGTIPLVIFPPWINRFYILDLTAKKSFVRWAVEQGLSVFIVSWKSADASMKDVIWDDYVNAQIDAIDQVRALLDVPSVHTIGYCVGGTTLAATLAVLTARGAADKVASATFFTAQVDFSRPGDLQVMVDDAHLKLIEQLSAEGFLDGRYLVATFNALRGKDLIWNYVVNNYLLGEDYPPFDLLFWNGDSTNLPAKWHKAYLCDLYRDNRLVQPNSLSIGGTPLDISLVKTPAYVQAGREDHIAPAASVWKITENFKGPIRFLLAGSGHIAGVVNPPDANKYQYWTGDSAAPSFEAFVETAKETKGSWWPDWILWIRAFGGGEVPATGARLPGQGALKAIEDAPGSYVKAH